MCNGSFSKPVLFECAKISSCQFFPSLLLNVSVADYMRGLAGKFDGNLKVIRIFHGCKRDQLVLEVK